MQYSTGSGVGSGSGSAGISGADVGSASGSGSCGSGVGVGSGVASGVGSGVGTGVGSGVGAGVGAGVGSTVGTGVTGGTVGMAAVGVAAGGKSGLSSRVKAKMTIAAMITAAAEHIDAIRIRCFFNDSTSELLNEKPTQRGEHYRPAALELSVFMENYFTESDAFFDIDYTLVFAASPLEGQTFFVNEKHSVDQNISGGEKRVEGGVIFAGFQYFFESVAGIAPDIETTGLCFFSQLCTGGSLQIGLSARKGEAVCERIGRKRFIKTVYAYLFAAGRIPGVRVVALGTVTQTALSKYHKTETGAVNDGILYCIGYPQYSITHCSHRCRS